MYNEIMAITIIMKSKSAAGSIVNKQFNDAVDAIFCQLLAYGHRTAGIGSEEGWNGHRTGWGGKIREGVK